MINILDKKCWIINENECYFIHSHLQEKRTVYCTVYCNVYCTVYCTVYCIIIIKAKKFSYSYFLWVVIKGKSLFIHQMHYVSYQIFYTCIVLKNIERNCGNYNINFLQQILINLKLYSTNIFSIITAIFFMS